MTKVLITGASTGIGRDLAFEFGKHNHSLLLVARSKDRLKELKEELIKLYEIDVDYFVCDLSDNYNSLFEYCESKNIQVDVLINNAGFGDYSEFINADVNKLTNMIDLNDKALVALTYYFTSKMKELGGGFILNTASVASFVSGPYMATYYASKSFVLSFSLALRQELKKYNIGVSCLCPGPTKTPFWNRAGAGIDQSTSSLFARSSKDVSKTAYRIYRKNKPYEIDGLLFKISFWFLRLLPPSLSSRIMALVQSKTKYFN